MMTDRLKALMERAGQPPPPRQDRLVEEIENLLDDVEWRALLADPRSGPVLDELLVEAKRSPKRPWPTPADMCDSKELLDG